MDVQENLRVALYDLLADNFPTEYGSALPIKRENARFVKVDGPFLATYIMFNSGRRASIGTLKKFTRHEGFFCIECQVPEDTGTSVMWKMAGACQRALFEQNLTLADGSYVTIETPKVVGNTSQDGHYFVTVMIPVCMDECNA